MRHHTQGAGTVSESTSLLPSQGIFASSFQRLAISSPFATLLSEAHVQICAETLERARSLHALVITQVS